MERLGRMRQDEDEGIGKRESESEEWTIAKDRVWKRMDVGKGEKPEEPEK